MPGKGRHTGQKHLLERNTRRQGRGVVSYEVTIADEGAGDAVGVTATDDLSGVLDDAEASCGDLAVDGTNLNWTGSIPAGETVTLTYSVTTHNPTTGDDQLVNKVTSPDTNGTEDSTDPDVHDSPRGAAHGGRYRCGLAGTGADAPLTRTAHEGRGSRSGNRGLRRR